MLTGRKVTDIDSAQSAASELLTQGVGCAIIKLGERGAVLAQGGSSLHIPAFQVRAVDTTAAGDAFAGGLAAAIMERKTIGEACVFASAVAALSVEKPGAETSMPTRADVDEFLRARSQ